VIAACCVVLSTFAGALAVVPSAQADPPDPRAQKKQLDSEIKESRADLHESYDALQKTVTAYDQATAQLKAVQTRYAAAQGQLAAARAADVVAAGKLKAAEEALAAARTDVFAGEQLIAEKQQLVGRAVRSAYQQQSSLVSLTIVLRGASPADLATGIQVQRNVFGIHGNAITNLNNAQAQLANKRAKVAEAERVVSAQRAEAARTVQRVTQLTEAVAAEKVETARVAQTRLTAFNAAEKAKNDELARYNSLVAERNRVQRILIARARAERAAAARRRAAAIAAERARAKREKRRERPIPTDPGSSASLSYPVNTYITSPYGMRFHPILGYWKLHDGTDFGAGCGTPIRAAADGVVTDKYYNGGYGNRLFVSHGVMRGSSITTVYNHLSRYSSYVGQRVRRGEVIGYVGTTGYSTGCHLHFMVYQDGQVVNPMNWL
jgi:murein DD-endopeptidase MepM/ murein hydrolase activator NlpD